MLRMLSLLVGLAAAAVSAKAECISVSIPHATIAEHGGSWTVLTRDQWEFVRGVSAIAPTTPEGLPPGESAVLAETQSRDGAIILFIDGEMACNPFPIPKVLVELIREVGRGKIAHEGIEQ